MITKEQILEIHEKKICSIKFTDHREGYGVATELGCMVKKLQDNGWYICTEYDFEGNMLCQGYEKGE